MQLDLVLENARVRTMDPARPIARRVGVWGGRIIGLDDDVAGIDAAETIDLRGRTVLPGFVDAHNHLAWTGLAQRSLDLAGATTIPAALDRIGAAAAAAPAGGWVDVVGYDQRPLGRHLTRHDLDAVSAGRRVYVIHASGHAHLVNSAVLAVVPAAELADRPGVVLDDDGAPTGLFLEEATAAVNAVRTPYGVNELSAAIAAAGRTCAAQGITFAAEAGVGGGLSYRSPIEGGAFQDAVDSGAVGLRVQLMISLDLMSATPAHPDDGVVRAFPLGLRTGLGSDRLSFGAAKTWLDGGMMARTAALTEPYVGGLGCGQLAADLAEISAAAVAAHCGGWQLALHAIGDRAIDAAIDIVEAAQRARPRPDARHRIEHCGLVRPDQLPRLAANRITAVIQPTFLHAFGDDYAQIMGPKRSPWMYRGRSFLQHGIALAGSSDRPVADGAPLRGIQFMVERRSASGSRIGPDEAITIGEALQGYTMGAAAACRVADRVGSISVGKHADFVVLEADPMHAAPAELAAIPVLATAVGGALVYGEWPVG